MAKFPGTPIFACGLNKSFNFDPEEPTFKRPDIKPLNLAKENLNDFLIEQGSDQFNNLKFIQILKKFHLSQIETLENSEFTNEHAIKYLISVLENFNLFVFPEIESKGLDKVLQAMQRMLENYLETLDKGQTGTDYYYVVTSHFTREMKKQIEKITEKPVFFKANFEDLWLSFKRILEKTQIESKEMKKKLNETREKLKGLKEKVATISEILELTDMPKIPRTL